MNKSQEVSPPASAKKCCERAGTVLDGSAWRVYRCCLDGQETHICIVHSWESSHYWDNSVQEKPQWGNQASAMPNCHHRVQQQHEWGRPCWSASYQVQHVQNVKEMVGLPVLVLVWCPHYKWVLMKESRNHNRVTKNNRQKPRTMIEFRMNLAKLLIGDYRENEKEALATISNGHFPEKGEKWGRCRQCSKNQRRREVLNRCKECNIHLFTDCFEPYHRSLARNR